MPSIRRTDIKVDSRTDGKLEKMVDVSGQNGTEPKTPIHLESHPTE